MEHIKADVVIVGAGAGFFGIYTNSKSPAIIPKVEKEACETCGK